MWPVGPEAACPARQNSVGVDFLRIEDRRLRVSSTHDYTFCDFLIGTWPPANDGRSHLFTGTSESLGWDQGMRKHRGNP